MRRGTKALYASVAISIACVCMLLPVDESVAANPVTLKVMRPGYPKEARAFFTEVQKALTKEYPNIQLEIVDSDWNTFHSRAPIWVVGKQEPDVYLCSQTDLAGFVDIGAVMTLDGLIDPTLRADIPVGAWNSVKYQGRTVAIPGDYAPFVLWYNKDIFKKAGLNPQKPPTTWDELLQQALKIKQSTDVVPIGVGVGRALDFTQLVWGMLFYSATNEQYVDDLGRPQLTSENSIRAHQFLVDLVRKHKVTLPDPQLYSKGDLRLLFRDEKVAMVVDGPWLMNVVASKTDLSAPDKSKFGIAPAPRSSAQGKIPMYASTTDAWVISANSKHPEEAKKVLQFLLRPEWQYAHDQFVQQMPFRKSLYREPAKYPLANNWIYRGMSEAMDNSISFQPIIPTANAVFEAMKNGVVKMVTGAASVEVAAKEASDAIKAANGIK
jgi:ABC-type glycerol-3-phosphate transport system substrate-binding protein